MFCPFGRDKFGRTAAAAEDLEYGDEEKQTVRVPHVLQVIRRKRLGLFGGQSSTPKQETSNYRDMVGRPYCGLCWAVLIILNDNHILGPQSRRIIKESHLNVLQIKYLVRLTRLWLLNLIADSIDTYSPIGGSPPPTGLGGCGLT